MDIFRLYPDEFNDLDFFEAQVCMYIYLAQW